MHIVAIGWIYVVLMMSITEQSVIAGIMTFLMYGVLPLTIILYLTGGRRRRDRRAAAEQRRKESETRGAQSRSESVNKPEV
jgi:biotin transporter BioY